MMYSVPLKSVNMLTVRILGSSSGADIRHNLPSWNQEKRLISL